LEHLGGDFRRLQQELDDSGKEKDDLRKEIANSQEKIAASEAENAAKDEKAVELNKNTDKLAGDVRRLRQELKNRDKEKEDLRQELAASKAVGQQLEKQAVEEKEAKAQMKSRIGETEEDLAAKMKMMRTLNASMEQIAEDNAKLSETMAGQAHQLTEASATLVKERASHSKFIEDMEAQWDHARQAEGDLKAKLKILADENEQLKNRMQLLANEHDAEAAKHRDLLQSHRHELEYRAAVLGMEVENELGARAHEIERLTGILSNSSNVNKNRSSLDNSRSRSGDRPGASGRVGYGIHYA